MKYQWRLSFSRAETILLNTWTPEKQIIYHILRFVLKESGLCKFCDSNEFNILSRYHMKTLMMWTCEGKHSTWWAQSNVIQLSCWLMQLLLRCCESGYFIADSNLLECKVTSELKRRLTFFTDLTNLTEWMINNDIRRCAQRCPHDIQRLFDDIRTNETLHIATNAVVQWRIRLTTEDDYDHMRAAVIVIHRKQHTFNLQTIVKSPQSTRDS